MTNIEMTDQLRQDIERVTPQIEGWQDVQRGIRYAELILAVNPITVVEIGVFAGRSLIPQAMALKEIGMGGTIYGIDPWRLPYALAGLPGHHDDKTTYDMGEWEARDMDAVHKAFMDKVYELRLEDYVIPIRCRSVQAHWLFDRIDILHIDGSHAEHAAVLDVRKYLPKVLRGGYIWFDDTNFKSTQKALTLLGEYASLEADYGTYRLYKV